MIRRKLVFVSLLLILPISLFCQSRRSPGPGGSVPAKLIVQLTTIQSRPLLNAQVYIEVSSFEGGSKRGYTDSNGELELFVMSGARYQLTASGPDIATESTSFEIPPGERFHHEEIQVKLHTEGETKAPGGKIAVSNLRVPEKARAEFAKGMKEMSAHNWSKAREHFEKAIKNYPPFDWSYNNIGVTYIQEKNMKAALEAFEKAVSINDRNPDAVRNLARMKLMGNDCSAAKELLLKLGPDPHDFDALTMLAYAQLNMHELEAALANALKVHQGEPDRFPLAHLIAARVYEINGNRGAAQEQYQMYLKEAPNTPEAQVAKDGMQRLAANR